MSRPRSPLALAGSLLYGLAVLAAAAAVLAQAPPAEPPAAAFGERIDVVLVEVETVVVDRGGRRVAGLGRDDFRLLVDGEPVEIAVFEEVRGGAVMLARDGDAKGAEGAETVSNGLDNRVAADSAAPSSMTRYLVIVDEYFGSPADRAHVLDRLRTDLSLVSEGDPIAVVAWDGRRLEVVAKWTTDRGDVDRALERVASRRGGAGDLALRRTVTSEQRVRLLANQLAATYRAVTAALQGFAGGSGRSVALLVSGGWPFDPGGGGGFRSMLVTDTRDDVRRLAEVANAAGFTLYPIDVPGAEPDPTLSADVAGLDDVSGRGLQPLEPPDDGTMGARLPAEPAGPDRMSRAFEARWREFDAESTLLLLARETGGVALINGQRTSALRQAVADVSSYYRLAFYHSSRADGVVRQIEVEVARPGLTARSRRSFADLTTATRAKVALEQALLLGRAEGTEPLFVRLGEARPAGRRQVEVPFVVRIPMGQVTVTPAGRGKIATDLELHIAVQDEEGRRNTVATLPIEIETEEAAVAGYVTWEATVKLRRQAHEVLFALSDPASGRVFVSSEAFDGG